MDKWNVERIDRLEDKIYDLETQILMDRYKRTMKKHNINIGVSLVLSFFTMMLLVYMLVF